MFVAAYFLASFERLVFNELEFFPGHRYMKLKGLPQGKFPIMSTGNGDCLFNSVGIALFGTEDVAPILRLGSIQAAMQHVDHFVGDVSSKDSKASL